MPVSQYTCGLLKVPRRGVRTATDPATSALPVCNVCPKQILSNITSDHFLSKIHSTYKIVFKLGRKVAAIWPDAGKPLLESSSRPCMSWHHVAITRYHLKYKNQTVLRAEIDEKTNFTEQSSQFLPGLKLFSPETQVRWFAEIQVSEGETCCETFLPLILSTTKYCKQQENISLEVKNFKILLKWGKHQVGKGKGLNSLRIKNPCNF